MSGANLQAANLSYAELQGAVLRQSSLQAAALTDTALDGADLGHARLWQAGFRKTKLGLSDLRSADFTTQTTQEELQAVEAAIALGYSDLRSKQVKERLATLQSSNGAVAPFDVVATAENPILVDHPQATQFAKAAGALAAKSSPDFAAALANLLADHVATANPDAAKVVANRSSRLLADDVVLAPVACRLIANAESRKVRLDDETIKRLRQGLTEKNASCNPAPNPAR